MEGSTNINIRVSVLYIYDRSAIGVVKHILHPNELERVQIKTHEVAAVISEEGIMIYNSRRGFNTEPVF